MNSNQRKFKLDLSSELDNWLEELTLKGELISSTKNANEILEFSDGNIGESGQLVKGITFYSDDENELEGIDQEKLLIENNKGLEIAVLPGGLKDNNPQMIRKEELGIEKETQSKNELGFSMDYKLDDKLNLNTEYYLLGLERESSMDESNSGIEDSLVGVEGLSESQEFPDNIQKVGINYQTSQQTSVFADYLEKRSADEDKLTTTAVGLEYNNDSGKITMQYQVENSENEESSSAGIELGLSDFAKLKAIYTMVNKNSTLDGEDGEKLEEGPDLKSQSLDLGLDLYVNEDTSVKLGYQLADEDKKQGDLGDEDLLDKIKPKAADIKLEIKF
jgi:hypothetical protein